MKRTWPTYLTDAAFVLLLGVLIARVLTSDALRDPTEVMPGGIPQARASGPATALVLDSLMTLPASLVLIRRAVDGDYRLNRPWVATPLAAVALWAVASTGWAADRFAAVVTGVHWLAAATVFWTAVQLTASWSRLRIVVGTAFGLLLVLATHAGLHEFVDKKADIDFWTENKPRILAERGMAPDSFSAKQFEQKVMTGELIGFFKSANSTAAVAVMLFAAVAGLGLQNLSTDRHFGRLAFTSVAVAATVFVLYLARSKTAIPTPIMGAVALAIYAGFGDRLRPHARQLFAAGSVAAAAGIALVVAIGVHKHGLFAGHFSNSLDFRWKYWTAAAGIVRDHPIAGVGADNFGLSYLAHRLPEAAESIKDPHNLFVRVASELGLVGLLMTVGAVLWIGRAMTVPGPSGDVEQPRDHVRLAGFIVAVGLVLSLAIHIDFDFSIVNQSVDILRLVMYLALIAGAVVAASVRSMDDWYVDGRPAPVLRAGLVIGVVLFGVHNLIDFSLFETNAMPLVAVLAGAAVGANPSPGRSGSTTVRRLLPLAAAMVSWLVAVGGLTIPVVIAESSAADGDDLVRSTPAEATVAAANRLRAAVVPYHAAISAVPYNADYRLRAARAEYRVGDVGASLADVAEAIRLNPLLIDGYLLDGRIRLTAKPPDVARVVADFDRVVALNPNDVSLRLEYADALDRLGLSSVEQLRAALAADAALPVGEPQRLSAGQVATIGRRITNGSENRMTKNRDPIKTH